MNPTSLTLDSGKTLTITPAPFEDADALATAVIEAVRGVKLSASMFGDDLGPNLMANPDVMNEALDKIIAVATSPKVKALFWVCARRCAYEGVKVEPALFDDANLGPAAREDYFPVFQAILKENIQPFFKRALSGLRALVPNPVPAPSSPAA